MFLELKSKEGKSLLKVEKGDIAVFNIPSGKDLRVAEQNPYGWDIYIKPYWVEFNLLKFTKHDLKFLNLNSDYLKPFFYNESYLETRFSNKSLSYLSGWHIRLLNLFLLSRLKGVEFFELNIAGLSKESIKLCFEFLLKERDLLGRTFLIINPINKTNSMSYQLLKEESVEGIIDSFQNSLGTDLKFRD